MSIICMKLDPGMHIGLHLVFFGKTGVTVVVAAGPRRGRWRGAGGGRGAER
jgi:hypothetical protein